MKKRISLLLALALVFSVGLTACGGSDGASGDDPVGVAKQFVALVNDKKPEEVAKICTEDFADIGVINAESFSIAAEMAEDFAYEASDYQVVDETDDSCGVTMKTTIKALGIETDGGKLKVLLTKVDGKWLMSGLETVE